MSEASATDETWPEAYTSNGVLITPGLRVRDYNWDETEVTTRKPSIDSNYEGGPRTPWFFTANGGMFDGSRLRAL